MIWIRIRINVYLVTYVIIQYIYNKLITYYDYIRTMYIEDIFNLSSIMVDDRKMTYFGFLQSGLL